MRRLIILPVAVLALLLVVGCGGIPKTDGIGSAGTGSTSTPLSLQGAQTQTGQQGQVGETGSATNHANPTILNLNLFGKSRLRIGVNPENGEPLVEAETEGGSEFVGPVHFHAPYVRYGEDSVHADVSSGGGGAAGVGGDAAAQGRGASNPSVGGDVGGNVGRDGGGQ